MISISVFLVTQTNTKSYQKSQIRKSAHEIVLATKYARLLAIESQQSVYLNLNSENKEMSVLMSSMQEGVKEIKKDPLFKLNAISDEVNFDKVQIQSSRRDSFSSTLSHQHQIAYHPDGSCDRAMIVLNLKDFYLSLHTSPFTGKTTVLDGIKTVESGVIDLDAI